MSSKRSSLTLTTTCSAKLGYCEYRTHNFLMDQVAATYGGNNQIQLRFQEALKDAIDPNGILAPGKRCAWLSSPAFDGLLGTDLD